MYLRLTLLAAATLSIVACSPSNTPAAPEQNGNSAAAKTAEISGMVSTDGSSTVFPVTEAMAEEFQKENAGIKVTVGMSGTGGGFKKFCRGETDISNSSRPIKGEEKEACKAAGVEYIELPVAMDALTVVVNPQNIWPCSYRFPADPQAGTRSLTRADQHRRHRLQAGYIPPESVRRLRCQPR